MTTERKDLAAWCRGYENSSRRVGLVREEANFAAIVAFLDPPAHPDDVVVRIAVAENYSGKREAAVIQPDDISEAAAFETLRDYDGFDRNPHIVTVRLRRAVVPVVEGETET